MKKDAELAQKKLPKPISWDITRATNFIILRFGENDRPNYEQSVAIAEQMKKSMLSISDVNQIENSTILNNAFLDVCKVGDWGYVNDQGRYKSFVYIGKSRRMLLHDIDILPKTGDEDAIILVLKAGVESEDLVKVLRSES